MPTPTICIGIENGSKADDVVRVSCYDCKDTKNTIVATDMPAAYSPYTGKFLTLSSDNTTDLTIGEIREDPDVISVGCCPTCQTEHIVSASSKAYFVDEGHDLHCTMCNTEYTPVLSSDNIDSYLSDDYDDDNDEDDDISVISSDDDDTDEDEDEDNTVIASDNDDYEDNETQTNLETVSNPTSNEVDLNNDFVINCADNFVNNPNTKYQLVPVTAGFSLILADDLPIVRLLVDKAGENSSLYNNPKALASAVQAIVKNKSTDFSSIGGEPIQYTISVAKEVETKINNGIKAATASINEEKANLDEEYKQSLEIAAAVITKNIDKNIVNPVRVNMIETLSGLNIKNAENIVDSVLERSSEAFAKTVLAKAYELRQQPLEARNTIALFVKNSNFTKIPLTASTKEDNSRFGKELEENSISFSTASAIVEEPAIQPSKDGVNHYRSLFQK